MCHIFSAANEVRNVCKKSCESLCRCSSDAHAPVLYMPLHMKQYKGVCACVCCIYILKLSYLEHVLATPPRCVGSLDSHSNREFQLNNSRARKSITWKHSTQNNVHKWNCAENNQNKMYKTNKLKIYC